MKIIPRFVRSLWFACAPVAAWSGEKNSPAEALPAPENIAQLFLDDMTLPNPLRPVRIEYDWTHKPRLGAANILPEGWTHTTMWGQIYAGRPGNPAKNVRIQIRNCAQWVLSRRSGQWILLQHSVTPEGAWFNEDFKNNTHVPAPARTEPDGSLSVRLEPGYNYHFWPTVGRQPVTGADLGGVASVFFARLVVDDPRLPDDVDEAVLIGSGGGDYWRSLEATWKADFSNNIDWGMGRFKRLTRNWQVFTACTYGPAVVHRKRTASAQASLPKDFPCVLQEKTLRANPPPVRSLFGASPLRAVDQAAKP